MKEYAKIPASEIIRRREALGLTVPQIACALRMSEATWGLWERKDLAPAFAEFLLRYLETPGQALAPARKGGAASPVARGTDWRERFFSHTRPADDGSGCLLWLGAEKFELRGRALTPRKAAWLIKSGGHSFSDAPAFDVRVMCGRTECVAAEHLALSAKRTGRRTPLATAVKSAILLELRRGEATGRQLQEKYGVSAGTISALRKQVARG
jgi:transcriptional regulator with XRE-family HTH domain